LKNLFIIIIAVITLSGCKTNINIPADGKSTPLFLRDGLLYADSTAKVPFTGRNKSKALDQVVEYDVLNGVKEGEFIIYYPNQKIQMIGKMKGNKNVGEWKYYFSDGSLQTSGYYDDDIPNGKWIWYNPKGKIMEEGNFLNGIRDGEWKSYDSVGNLSIVRIYKDSLMIDSTKIE